MKKNLTTRFVENITVTESRKEYFDTKATGLALRVTRGGTKTWMYQYRIHGRQRKHKIGRYPTWSLAEARKEAGRLQVDIDQGKDPRAAKDAMKELPMVSEVMDAFIKEHVSGLKTAKDAERILNKDVRPYIGSLFIKDVTKSHLLSMFKRAKDRGAPIMANRIFEVVRKMFNWAVARDLIPYSPCMGLERPTKNEIQRERALDDFEIKKFWTNLDQTDMAERYKLGLKLMLMTGQRKGEIIQAHKSEFNLTDKVWTIPNTRTKNKKTHHVPLTQTALDLVRSIAAIDENSEWLFEANHGGKGCKPKPLGHPIRAIGINRYFQEARSILDIEEFRIHDLRRTAATLMGREGIAEFDIGKVLNHSTKHVTAIYNRHDYMPQKRHALEVLEGVVLEMIRAEQTAPNVLSFRQAI